METSVGDLRRIDVETGSTVFEVKRDLRKGGVLETALTQLAGYVATREAQMGRRYVGVLTDGAEWRAYRLVEGGLEEASVLTVRKPKPETDQLVIWLEGVLATAQQVPPLPEEIAERLGFGSSSHALDRSSLADLYFNSKNDPSVQMKRELWARLLTTALGSHFVDSDELFVEHTLLVNTAEVIAHAVLGLDVQSLAPASLVSGAKFTTAGIYGVVEQDFFDWVVDVPGGETFIRTLARRLARFNWTAVEHDVLKVLYESVIPQDTRKQLGEYYTPDWLAEAMVDEVIVDPLAQRVLDPACGSGTFLFHLVRRYLRAAEEAGLSVAQALSGVSLNVMGMDLHPVAVTLARVTYVLALGTERLGDPDRGTIQVPVYLGDSMQWQQKSLGLFTAGFLVIQVQSGEASLFALELKLPTELLEDASEFDRLVTELTSKATSRPRGERPPSLIAVFQRYGIPDKLQGTVQETFQILCQLHDQGRNHIWGYYIRNLARPVWLSQSPNRVNTLIGNPPWLAYRYMTGELQERFRQMSNMRGLWHGATIATHQDLSGLFVGRVIQLYLENEGRFAFVMPNAVLDRAQFAGFRTGVWAKGKQLDPVFVRFDKAWDLRRIRPHIFPRGAAVIFGRRAPKGRERPMPGSVQTWSGKLERGEHAWSQIMQILQRRSTVVKPIDNEVGSAYSARFRQGATLVPRVLLIAEETPRGPLGLPAGSRPVRSFRSAYEKPPWKDLDSLEGVVEGEFVHSVYFGEHVLPYRTLRPTLAILPVDDGKDVMHGAHPRLDRYPGLAEWWRRAEELWLKNRSSKRLSLLGRVDYHGGLRTQFPIPSQRVVYAKSGMHLCAARLGDRRALIDHTLYWATVHDADEALFLCAVVNSAAATQLVRPLMSYAKDERDIHKHIWKLPIPTFNPEDDLHARLARAAAAVEAEIQSLDLEEKRNFVALRRELRRFLEKSPKGQEIEDLVLELLD